MAFRGLFRYWPVVFCVVPILLCCGFYGGCFYLQFQEARRPHQTWESAGPVQVLGGPDEVWVFMQKENMVRIPGWLTEAPVRSDGHSQEVVVFDVKGEKRRTIISEPSPSFHSNRSRIFRQDDDFYLVTGQAMGCERSLFRWSNDHFELLPLEQSEAWMEKVGLKDNFLPQFDPAIDRITEKSGWKRLYDDKPQLGHEEGSFVWNGLRLQFKIDKGAIGKARLFSLDPGNRLDITVLEFDRRVKEISYEEYHARPSIPEPGHTR